MIPDWIWTDHEMDGKYAVLRLPEHPLADRWGRVRRSHFVLWCEGILVPEGCDVHHKDQNTLNDHPDNLQVLTRSKHKITHLVLKNGAVDYLAGCFHPLILKHKTEEEREQSRSEKVSLSQFKRWREDPEYRKKDAPE